MTFINEINDILWTYILIIMLLGCAVWFSIRTRFVQFRMIREMIVLLSESAGKGKQGEKHVSSCLLYTSPSPRDGLLSRMPSSA